MLGETDSVCSLCGKVTSSHLLGRLAGKFFRGGTCQCPRSAWTVPVKLAGAASNRNEDEVSALVVNDRYEAESVIGHGGMAAVYKVRDRDLNQIFALKVLDAELAKSTTQVQRFRQEARASIRLRHPNIVTVHNQGLTDAGLPFLLMDYLHGCSLAETLRAERSLPSPRAVEIFIQLCDALKHAHSKGVVHRDIKPSNILLSMEGETESVKILDFGIAKLLPSASSPESTSESPALTQTGDLFGSPLYMSPEQITGGKLDERTDIYSLGCVMYETLTGVQPFAAENSFKIMLKHVQEAPPPFDSLKVAPAPQLQNVVLRCLEKSPAKRYQSIADLKDDLETIRQKGGPDSTRSIRTTARRLLAGNSGKRVLSLTAILLAAALVAISFTHRASYPPRVQPAASILPGPAPAAVETRRPDTWKGKTLSDWDAEIEKHPNDPNAYFGRGTLLQRRDERRHAISDISRAIELKPDFLEAYRTRAQLYALLNDAPSAFKDSNTLIKLSPNWGQAYSTRGFIQEILENNGQAAADFTRAIELDGNDSYAAAFSRYSLARCLVKLGRYEEAARIAAASATAAKGQKLAISARGIHALALCNLQRFEEARRELEEITQSKDARGVEFGWLAYCYIALNRPQDADRAKKQSLEAETFPSRGHRLLGELARIAGDMELAIKEFGLATDFEQYAPSYRQRALCYLALNKRQNAFDDLKTAMQLNPESKLTLSALARAEAELGMTARATQHAKESIAQQPIAPILYVNEAAILLTNHKLNEAMTEVNKALAIDPYLKEAYLLRGQLYELLGDKKRSADDGATAKKLIEHLDG